MAEQIPMEINPKHLDFKNPMGLKLLYGQCAPKLYKYCLSFAKDEQAAKEVVQEVFVTLWEKRNAITIDGEIEPYLIKLAKFKLIDNYRAAERIEKLRTSVKIEESPVPTPEDYLSFEDAKSHMLTVFKALPKKARRIFFLSRKKGFTNKQIAKDLHISEKTVEYHIKKSLKQFRASFFGYY